MGIFAKQSRNAYGMAALLLALVFIAGCAGITPYEPRNNREEGPEQGLFTGSEGEFVIYRSGEKPKPNSEQNKHPDEATDTGQAESNSAEKGSPDETSGCE
jgi:hypothetical protein